MPVECKSSMQSQSQLPKVSTRLGLVWQESQLGSGSFLSSENEIVGSASITNNNGSELQNSSSSVHPTYYIVTWPLSLPPPTILRYRITT